LFYKYSRFRGKRKQGEMYTASKCDDEQDILEVE